MYLRDFYAKDDCIVSAMYNSKKKKAEVVVDPNPLSVNPGNRKLETPGWFTEERNLLYYVVPCSEGEFQIAFKDFSQLQERRG